MIEIRPANSEDLEPLANLWFETWREAHMAHVPEELTKLRTVESFYDRLASFGDRLRMSGSTDAPTGLCVIDNDELDQLFVSKSARGTGLAARLLKDGEERLAKQGTVKAHLLCLPENRTALKFYDKHGWKNSGPVVANLDTQAGAFQLKCDLLRKSL